MRCHSYIELDMEMDLERCVLICVYLYLYLRMDHARLKSLSLTHLLAPPRPRAQLIR